jgi:hypothetical protein
MPSISSLLSLPASHFKSDESYKDFTLNKVLPCIVQLVISVGKDILWKPLNHKILQMTRHQHKVTRLVALKSLQKLFIEVRRTPFLPFSLTQLTTLFPLPLLSLPVVLCTRWVKSISYCFRNVSRIFQSCLKMTPRRLSP